MTDFDCAPEYVAARAVLLNALVALSPHLSAIIVVGAQAVYLHTGTGDFVDPPMTTDGDVALDTKSLGSTPEIASALATAGFAQGTQPGRWIGEGEVPVDIMVAPSQSGRTSKTARSARIEGHQNRIARPTAGLEPALVDSTLHTLRALDPADSRQVDVLVAGPAALLVAKAIKFEERMTDTKAAGRRIKEKDALDILRLLQAIDTEELIAGLTRHLGSPAAAEECLRAIEFIRANAASTASALPFAAAAVADGDPTVAPSFVILVQELLSAFDGIPQPPTATSS
ncbi:hypothetical protein ACWFOS_01200 [Gordonia terrae]